MTYPFRRLILQNNGSVGFKTVHTSNVKLNLWRLCLTQQDKGWGGGLVEQCGSQQPDRSQGSGDMSSPLTYPPPCYDVSTP